MENENITIIEKSQVKLEDLPFTINARVEKQNSVLKIYLITQGLILIINGAVPLQEVSRSIAMQLLGKKRLV